MRYLLTFTILSLFLPIRLETGFVLLRPFEVLTLLAIMAGALTGRWRNLSFPAGFLLLLPFFGWHVASAFTASAQNGLRELLQISAVTGFAFVLAQEVGRTNIAEAARVLFIGMGLIFVYVIGWHLANGFWVGWKHLVDPKLVFTFLPVTLAGLLVFASGTERRILWLGWCGLFPLLLFSGERKALLIYIFVTAAILVRGRLAAIAPAVGAGLAGLLALSTVVENSYLDRQLQTLTNPESMGQYNQLLATGEYAQGDTPSNVQRAFAFDLSKRIFVEYPLVGIGTNQFTSIIDRNFGNLPKQLRLGIHGEFQRVLSENGIIGLSFYILIWLAAWLRLSRALSWAHSHALIRATRARLLPLILLAPCALYVGTEASGTRAFVTLILVSISPELTRHGLWLSCCGARRSHPKRMRHPRFVGRPLPGGAG